MEHVTPDSARVFLDEMWLKFAHLAQERVAALEAYVAAARTDTGTEEQRAAAESAAHKLVGALGSYQRPGSETASRAERLLIDRGPVEELAPLVQELRSIVGRPTA